VFGTEGKKEERSRVGEKGLLWGKAHQSKRGSLSLFRFGCLPQIGIPSIEPIQFNQKTD